MAVSWNNLFMLLLLAWVPNLLWTPSAGAGYYSIETGQLTSKAAEARAVAKLSSGPDQQEWWQLADAHWHDSALKRFFAIGPLQAEEMQALAAHNGSANAWTATKIKVPHNPTTNDLILVLQNFSTIAYRMNLSVTGTGVIEASLWMAMFKCASGTGCSQGYMAPIVIVPGPNAMSTRQEFSYATLWLPAATNMLLNAIPAFLRRPAMPAPVPPSFEDDLDDVSLLYSVRKGIPSCPINTTFVNYRTILDGSYGLVPGSACIKFIMGDHESFRLLVSLSVSSTNDTSIDSTSVRDDLAELLLMILQLTPSEWVPRPFEECSDEAVLHLYPDNLDYLRICHHRICVVTFSGINVTCSSQYSGNPGVQHLKPLVDIAKLEPTCTHNGKPLNIVGSEVFNTTSTVLCTIGISANQMSCTTTVDVAHESFGLPIIVVSPRSKWAYTKGVNTEEFGQAPKQISNPHPCALTESTRVTPPEALRIRARAYQNGYMAAHNIAFTMFKGPATDWRTFVALLLSTALSVTVAIPWPFTSFLLKMICRRQPFLFHSRRGIGKIFCQVISNVVLCGFSFIPLLKVGWDEMEREKPFYTWDLGSTDLVFYDASGSKMHMRVLYLHSANSKYESPFVIVIIVVVCITCIIVAGCTVWRCLQIFKRYACLQVLYDTQRGSECSVNEDQSAVAMRRAIRAIEMTDTEYLEISSDLESQYNFLLGEQAGQSTPHNISSARNRTRSLPMNRTALTQSSAAAQQRAASARAILYEPGRRPHNYSEMPSA